MSNATQSTGIPAKYEWAINQLSKSERGQATLDLIRYAVDRGPLLGLDGLNKAAVIDLLIDLWGEDCGDALDALRNASTVHEC